MWNVDQRTNQRLANQRQRALRNAHRKITHSFEIIVDLDRRRHQPEISRQRRLQSEQADRHVVDLNLELVDPAFVAQHLLREIFILLDNALHTSIHRALDKRAHLQKFCF